MPTEVEIERDIDPATGNVTKTVTESLDDSGDVVITTTTFARNGGIQMRVRDTFHRPPGDPRYRSNLVERVVLAYAEDGRTVIKETDEYFNDGVNETRTTQDVYDWQIDPGPPKNVWRKFIYHYHW